MKVLLLNPPLSSSDISTEPLLNLSYLAVVLRNHGHEVHVVDATAPYKKMDEMQVLEYIKKFTPTFIGITLTVVYVRENYEFIKRLKTLGIPIVVGGPHPNAMPEEALDNCADIIVVGEGEETIVDLAEHFIIRGNPLENIAGIAFKKQDGTIHFTGKRELIKDIDSIPFPDFDDFPIENYTGSKNPSSNPIFWSVFSSRGCPFNCTFCSSHNVFGRTIRLRSARNVFDEIKSIHDKYGATKITFQDDEILCNKKRFIELCDLLIESKIDVKWSIRTRIDSIDEETLSKAYDAGLRRISFGIESFNDETLTKVNKKYSVNKIHEKFKILSKIDKFHISFNNIIGFPWEDKRHLDANLREISRLPHSIRFFMIAMTPIPYPKTALYEEYHKEFGLTDWWLDLAKHPERRESFGHAFFLLFLFNFEPIFKNDTFWNYSLQKKRDIQRFCWSLFHIFLLNHYGKIQSGIIYFLCLLSVLIWRLSPKLELILFYPLTNSSYIWVLRERIVFVAKY